MRINTVVCLHSCVPSQGEGRTALSEKFCWLSYMSLRRADADMLSYPQAPYGCTLPPPATPPLKTLHMHHKPHIQPRRGHPAESPPVDIV